jgi:SAM-dependent methyltransferase
MTSSSETRYSAYDIFADIHSKSWGPELREWIPDIEEFITKHLPEGVAENPKILDLCCGTGELAQSLQNKGYQVTGLDGSEEMLHYARQNAVDSEFILDDARFFQLPSTFHGVVSTNFGLNHVIKLEELTCVFRNVYAALLTNGVFMFDFRLDEYYKSIWLDYPVHGEIEDDYVWTLIRSYDSESRIGQIEIAIFKLVEKNWKRSDTTWLAKGYFRDEVESALKDAGFAKITIYDAASYWSDRRKAGLVYFVCYK